MSFSYDPFSGMVIAYNRDAKTYKWHCGSCGGAGGDFASSVTAETLRFDFERHVKRSHEIDQTDTVNWHKL